MKMKKLKNVWLFLSFILMVAGMASCSTEDPTGVDVSGQRNNLRGKSDKFISLPERKSAKVMETSGYLLLLRGGTVEYVMGAVV